MNTEAARGSTESSRSTITRKPTQRELSHKPNPEPPDHDPLETLRPFFETQKWLANHRHGRHAATHPPEIR